MKFIQFLSEFDPQLATVLTEAYTSIFESDYVKSRLDAGESVASRIIDAPVSDMYDRFTTENNGGFLFDYDDFTLVLFKQIPKAYGEYMLLKNKPTLIMYTLDEYNNQWMNKLSKDWQNNKPEAERILKSIRNELNKHREVIVHEWTHAEDDKANFLLNNGRMRKPSDKKIDDKVKDIVKNIGDSPDEAPIKHLVKLINSDIEFNAQLVAGISEAIKNGKTNTFDEFLDSIIKSTQFKSIYATNKTMLIEKLYKKLLKRAYQYYYTNINPKSSAS